MKILITSASTGAGHVRAAQAIEAALHLSHAGHEFTHINVLDYVSRPFRRFYEGGYHFVANQRPRLWGFLYNMSNNPVANRLVQPALNLFQQLQAGHFCRFVSRYQPDRIVTTHFLIPQILACPVGRRQKKWELESVITDYGLHHYWLDSKVQRYYVAHDGMVESLTRAGVAPEKITVSGIPIDPVFLKEVNIMRVRQLMNLNPEVFTLLVLSGGMGFGSLDTTVKALFSLPKPLQIVTVSGKNEILKNKLDHLTPPAGVALINHGFVTNMHELLSVTDLVVSKAGGLTVSEGLTKGVPMIFFGPLPGQEDKNVAYVKGHEAGLLATTLEEVVQQVSGLMNDRSRLIHMRDNARAAARPQAAFAIAESITRESR